ncbi:hypothetical protein [Ancylobacter sp.]|uniref:hypothetical protein n=1 Tax=Ancylobacter sp. TaxID=1872567 RepID=UPI003D125AAB
MSASDDQKTKDRIAATDERRRDALRRLGKVAVYAAPATLGLMSVKRATAGS